MLYDGSRVLNSRPLPYSLYEIISITGTYPRVHVAAIGQIGRRLMELTKTTKGREQKRGLSRVTSSVCEWNSRKVARKWANGFAGSKPRLQTCIYYTTPLRERPRGRREWWHNGEPGTPRSCCFLVSRWQCRVANLHPTTALASSCPPYGPDLL